MYKAVSWSSRAVRALRWGARSRIRDRPIRVIIRCTTTNILCPGEHKPGFTREGRHAAVLVTSAFCYYDTGKCVEACALCLGASTRGSAVVPRDVAFEPGQTFARGTRKLIRICNGTLWQHPLEKVVVSFFTVTLRVSSFSYKKYPPVTHHGVVKHWSHHAGDKRSFRFDWPETESKQHEIRGVCDGG